MTMVYVKPRAGGRVRMPDRKFQPMKPEGSWVQRIDYYERLIVSGDLIPCDPPPPEQVVPQPQPEPKIEAPQGASSVSETSKES